MAQTSPLGKREATYGDVGVSGSPDDSQLLDSPFGLSEKASKDLAKEILAGFRRSKRQRSYRDLTAEKYLVHIDGEGDAQWTDIIDNAFVGLPPSLGSGVRFQYNLERPLVENMVAYHTSQKFQVVAKAKGDQQARDRAKVDTILANDILHRQNVNAVVADALFFAAAYGHCPVHAVWRADYQYEPWEPIYQTESSPQIRPGWVDIFPGDPWDTVYNDGARRHSVQWLAYGRVLPAELVRQAFAHLPTAQKLEGREGMPSASRMQRVLRRWSNSAYQRHGTGALFGDHGGDEMIALVCREIAPGIIPDYPNGQLQIIALQGSNDTDERSVSTYASEGVLLHNGPVPGGRFGLERFYAGYRGDDVLGKPYVADIDDLQVLLNQYVTLEVEYMRRFPRPPLKVLAGTLVDDTVTTEDDALLEFTDPIALQYSQFLYPPAGSARSPYGEVIDRTMDQMFRMGGWQAASRGESKSGDPAAKVIALARADDSIFGPVNAGIKQSVVRLMQLCHSLAREFMTVPWLVQEVTGEELGHLAEPYIRRDMISPSAPDFEVVSGAGATSDAKSQQLLQLVALKGADGKPLLSTDDFWRLYPDPTIRPNEIGADRLREARAIGVNYRIRALTAAYREQYGDQAPNFIEQAWQELSRADRIRGDDPPMLHIEVLSQLTQDESEDPFARGLAEMRQNLYRQMLMQQQMAAAGAAPVRASATPGRPARPGGRPSGSVIKNEGGTAGSAQQSKELVQTARQGMGALRSDVTSLTNQVA